MATTKINNPFETLNLKDVTDKYIKQNYNLDEHRKSTTKKSIKQVASINKEAKGNSKEVQHLISTLQGLQQNNTYVIFERGSFINDDKMYVKKKETTKVPETDQQVTTRLKKEVRKQVETKIILQRKQEQKRREKELEKIANEDVISF